MKQKLDVRRNPFVEIVEPRFMLSGSVLDSRSSLAAVALDSQPAQIANARLARLGHAVYAADSSLAVAQPATPITPAINGLTGTYFRGTRLKHQAFVRTDAAIDFDWGKGTPSPSLNRPFSVRWTGQIIAKYSETYTFSTQADDGVRLYIGGQLVINDWHVQSSKAQSGSIVLQAGQSYDLRLEYFENTVPPASVRLLWSSASQTAEPVPTTSLRTVGTAVPPVAAPPVSTPPIVGTPAPSGSGTQTPPVVTTPPPPPVVAAPAPVPAPAPVSTPAPLPESLGVIATAVSTNQIHLSWNSITDSAGYLVQRSSDGINGWAIIASTQSGSTQVDDNSVQAGTQYFYRVLSVSQSGVPNTSNIASATTPNAAPQPTTIYALTTGAFIYQIDTRSGSTTTAGAISFGTEAGDADPKNGNVYYVEQNTDHPRLAIWNPITKSNTIVGTLSVDGSVQRAAFRSDGTLYITANNGDLYTVNTQTAAATLVGQINGVTTSSGDMAFATDGTLYLESFGHLYGVNVTTLAVQNIGNDGIVGNIQIAFGPDHVLYATDQPGTFYKVNLTNGSLTAIGGTGLSDIRDLTQPPV